MNNNDGLDINQDEIKTNQDDIVVDPRLCKPIDNFDLNDWDRIQREYVSKGPCRPYGHNF